MGKTPMTWLELINQKLSALKKAGKSASIREVAPEAKAEWTKIKAGTHPDYIQGKAKTYARKHKTQKAKGAKGAKGAKSAKSAKSYSDADVKHILSTLKLCSKCSKQKGGKCDLPQYTGLQPLPNTTQAIAQVEKTGTQVENPDAQVEKTGGGEVAAPTVAAPTVAAPTVAPTPADTTSAQKGGNCGCNLMGGGKKHKHTKKCKSKK